MGVKGDICFYKFFEEQKVKLSIVLQQELVDFVYVGIRLIQRNIWDFTRVVALAKLVNLEAQGCDEACRPSGLTS